MNCTQYTLAEKSELNLVLAPGGIYKLYRLVDIEKYFVTSLPIGASVSDLPAGTYEVCDESKDCGQIVFSEIVPITTSVESECGCCSIPPTQIVYDQFNQIGDNAMYTSWAFRTSPSGTSNGVAGFAEVDRLTGIPVLPYYHEELAQVLGSPRVGEFPTSLGQWVEFNGVSGNSTDDIVYAIRKTTEISSGGAIPGSEQGTLVSYNKTTSTYSVLSTVTESGNDVAPVAAGFNNADGFIYVADATAVYRLDEATGVLTTMPIDILSITGGVVGSIDLDFLDGDLHIMIDGTVYVGDVNSAAAPTSPANYEFTGYTNPADSTGGYAIRVVDGVDYHYLIASNGDLLESDFTGAAPTVISTLSHPDQGSFNTGGFNDLGTTKLIQEAGVEGPIIQGFCLVDGSLVSKLYLQDESGILQPYDPLGTIATGDSGGADLAQSATFSDWPRTMVNKLTITNQSGDAVTITTPLGSMTLEAGNSHSFGDDTTELIDISGYSVTTGATSVAYWSIE